MPDDQNANLWKRANQAGTVGRYEGAPTLEPKSEADGMIDVVSDYKWTVSPTKQKDIPFVKLVEHKLDYNSLLFGAVYKTFGFSESIAGAITQLSEITSELGETIKKTRNEINELVENLDSINNSSLHQDLEDGPYEPYRGLYATSRTGWQYRLPYLQDYDHEINNSWGENVPGGVGMASRGLSEIYNTFVQFSNILDPGTFDEGAKYYTPPNMGQTYNVTFPLYNTISYDDIVKNWELCYLLTYQNLPNRRSRTLLDPPSLYSLNVQGIRHSPATVIQNLSIKHAGNTRLMRVGNHPGQKVIPEAYIITITFQELFIESRNIYNFIRTDDNRVEAFTEGVRESAMESIADFYKDNQETVDPIIDNVNERLNPDVE